MSRSSCSGVGRTFTPTPKPNLPSYQRNVKVAVISSKIGVMGPDTMAMMCRSMTVRRTGTIRGMPCSADSVLRMEAKQDDTLARIGSPRGHSFRPYTTRIQTQESPHTPSVPSVASRPEFRPPMPWKLDLYTPSLASTPFKTVSFRGRFDLCHSPLSSIINGGTMMEALGTERKKN